MGIVTWLTSEAMDLWIAPGDTSSQIIGLIVPVSVGVITYLGLAHLVHVEELGLVKGLVTRRSKEP
jgi:hypothetical protein